jgi:hypothetical protein
MESDLLEKALQASKRDDLSSAGLAPVQPEAARSAARTAPPPPRDPPVWFAMLSGTQTGPMSRAELGLKAASSTVTARTYVWKEGMSGWLRASEVGELASLFAAPPPAKPAPKPVPVPAKTPPAQKSAPKVAPVAAARALGAGAEFSTQDFGSLDLGGPGPADDKALSLELERPLQRAGVAGEADLASAKTTVPGRTGAKSQPVLAAAVPAPASAAEPGPAVSGISLEGLKPVGHGESDEEERTNVEALPLGERVHQEKVASELFSSGESSGGVSAVDLAKWASSELGKKPSSLDGLRKPGPPLVTPPGQSALAAAGKSAPLAGAGRKADPFANVPDAPDLLQPDKADTTGKVLARSGVTKSRKPMVFGVVFSSLVVVAVLAWALLGGEPKQEAPQTQEVARPSLGGTGDTQVGQLVGKDPAQKAPAAPPKKVAVAPPSPPEKAQDQKAAALTQEQAEALKQLDNERGVGNHGPKADAAPATPPPSSGDAQLSQADILRKLTENKGALKSCIEDALKREPGLKVGKVKIKTTIAPSGTVTSAVIDKPKVDESPLGACLKKAMRRIVFPSFSGEPFEVDIPLTITAGD